MVHDSKHKTFHHRFLCTLVCEVLCNAILMNFTIDEDNIFVQLVLLFYT